MFCDLIFKDWRRDGGGSKGGGRDGRNKNAQGAFKKVRKNQVSMTELLLDCHAEKKVKYREKE